MADSVIDKMFADHHALSQYLGEKTEPSFLQYATYFDWTGKTANTFFKLFGEPLGTSMREEVKKNGDLKVACNAFLELGYLRNCLVHQNFASFAFEKTAAEVYAEYKVAASFVDYVVGRLSESPLPLRSDTAQTKSE
jgi:hypothetical protein